MLCGQRCPRSLTLRFLPEFFQIADRDFVVDYLSAVATLFVHLSRLGEDLIFFQSDEAGFFTLSRSPHKRSSPTYRYVNPNTRRMVGRKGDSSSTTNAKGSGLAVDETFVIGV